MAKDDKKPTSAFEKMRDIQRELKGQADRGFWDWTKPYREAWQQMNGEVPPEPADDRAEPPTAKPPSWTEEGLLPIERARLMLADRTLFPNGTNGLSIAEVDKALFDECNRRKIKTWKRDTTARAMK